MSATEPEAWHHLAAVRGLAPDDSLLREALSHRSWSTSHNAPSNERLELLGAAALGWGVMRLLHESFPDNSEGEVAALKGRLVSAEILHDIGERLGVGSALLLSNGEEKSGGRGKQSVIADAVEACIGAVAVSRGIQAVEDLVAAWMAPEVARAREEGLDACLDPKGRLQIVAQSLGEGDPVYRFSVSGPDHAPAFRATVHVGGVQGWGEGTSKKSASAEAATRALQQLEAHNSPLGG